MHNHIPGAPELGSVSDVPGPGKQPMPRKIEENFTAGLRI
jgi:hypothetical protein